MRTYVRVCVCVKSEETDTFIGDKAYNPSNDNNDDDDRLAVIRLAGDA